MSFFACMSSNAPAASRVSQRVLHQFNLVVLDDPLEQTIHQRANNLSDLMVLEWPSKFQIYASNIADVITNNRLRALPLHHALHPDGLTPITPTEYGTPRAAFECVRSHRRFAQ